MLCKGFFSAFENRFKRGKTALALPFISICAMFADDV